jgi:hypothetical protein
MAEQGQLRDAMLLDSLLEIATTGEAQKYRSLEEAAEHYRVDLKLDKAGNDHYRKNYAELLGVPLVEVKDRGWFDYAAADALATYKVYEVQQQQVAALLKQNGPFQPGLNQLAHRWGYLTENIQVRAAIALDGPYRKGLTIDPVQREATRQKLRQEIQSAVEAVNTLVKEEAYHGCLPPNKPLYTLTAGGKPSHSTKALRMILEQVVVPALQKQKGIEVKIHRTKTGAISTAAEHWQEFTAVHPLIEHWRRIEEKSKLLQFVQNDAPVIHPRYRTLVSSGRTSCSGPNIQQLPREGAIREMIVPPPGQVFLGSDYATIELRTLASICLNRYGDSRLAEVFDRGEDPHANTAAIMLGMTYEQFLALKSTDEKRFGVERQKAKAINFGVPGGLGAPALIKYAKDTYGVTLTLEEAEALRNRLITEVYPEMGWYLEDDGMAALAWNFHTTPDQLWAELNWVGVGDRPGYVAGFYRRVLRGCKESADGKPYASAMLENVWARLRSVCRNEELRTRLDGNGSDRLLLDCTALPAITATGRIRGRCGFTQVRNTQFQGLAADGAKLALFELAKRGWEIAMFLHDEIIVCVPEGSNYETLGRELVDIMITSMERVVPNVKIAASEAVPMRCWSKAAKRVYDDTP